MVGSAMANEEVVVVERVFDHARDRVFERYADHEGWSRWAGFGKVWLAREGTSDRNGVGSVRAFRITPGLREEVTRFEPPTRMEYRVVAGPVPITGHRGEVLFEPEGRGTRVRWRASFRPLLPGTGWALRRMVELTFRRMLSGLARDLESRP